MENKFIATCHQCGKEYYNYIPDSCSCGNTCGAWGPGSAFDVEYENKDEVERKERLRIKARDIGINSYPPVFYD